MPVSVALLETTSGSPHVLSVSPLSHIHCIDDQVHGRTFHHSSFSEVLNPDLQVSRRCILDQDLYFASHIHSVKDWMRSRVSHYASFREVLNPDTQQVPRHCSDSNFKRKRTSFTSQSVDGVQGSDKDANEDDDVDEEDVDGHEGDEGGADKDDDAGGGDEEVEDNIVEDDKQETGLDSTGSSALPPMMPDHKSGDDVPNDFGRKYREDMEEQNFMMHQPPPPGAKLDEESKREMAEVQKLGETASMLAALEKSTSMASQVQGLMEHWRRPYVRRWVATHSSTQSGMLAHLLADITTFAQSVGDVSRKGRTDRLQDQTRAEQTKTDLGRENVGIQEAAFSDMVLIPWLIPTRDTQFRRDALFKFL